MQEFYPSLAIACLRWLAGKFAPAHIEIVGLSVRRGGPYHLRHRIAQCFKAAFTGSDQRSGMPLEFLSRGGGAETFKQRHCRKGEGLQLFALRSVKSVARNSINHAKAAQRYLLWRK